MVHQMLQYFQTYDAKISDIYWFLDKLRSELCALRMTSMRRGQLISTSTEALALRYIDLILHKNYQESKPDPKSAQKGYENWNRFVAWMKGEGREELEKYLGQLDPLRRNQTVAELEDECAERDGLAYLWRFGRRP